MDEQEKIALLRNFAEHPLLFHKYLFQSRHPQATPEFHLEILKLLHSEELYVGLQAFRGAGKTTLVEETILYNALFGKKKYILIVGSTYTNAVKVLTSIKNQIEMNEHLDALFGSQVNEPWTADTLVLKNGVRIEAFGAGQAMRGIKHNSDRPDLAVIDDLEDEDSAATKLAREKVAEWFFGVLIPALNPIDRRVLFIGTPLHPECLIEKVFADKNWVCKRFPIIEWKESLGESSIWPERFPLGKISEIRTMMYNQGHAPQFAREYLCAAEDMDNKPFKAHMLKVQPNTKMYCPTYIVCDPARTTNLKTSARTGYVCAAWQGNTLVVLDAFGAFHMPNEIIDTLFDWNNKYHPISVGVESNALDEFLRQPIRNSMLERHEVIPFQDLRAPRDKDSFIRGLQPFYNAGLVVHAKQLPDLENELMSYPSGRRDVVNALAYLLMLRPGNPVYSDFTENNIMQGLQKREDKPRYLVVSCRGAITTMAITQFIDGAVHILWDNIAYAPPSEVLGVMYQEAIQFAGELEVVLPADYRDSSTQSLLRYSFSKLSLPCRYGKSIEKSEGSLRPYLQKLIKGDPALIVSSKAKNVINGMLGGYCRKLNKTGELADNPIDNEYQVLIEGIEAWAATLDAGLQSGYNVKANYTTTKEGRRYMTTRPK